MMRHTGSRCWPLAVVLLAVWMNWTDGQAAEAIGAAQTYREAYDFGYEDGQEAGIEDRQKSRLYDLANRSEFQTADRGYEESRHERDVFMVAYRRGFEDGYEVGYGLNSSSGLPADAGSGPAGGRPDGGRLPLSSENTLSEGTEFEVELLDTLSTSFNQKGDTFRARVFRDIRLKNEVLVPEGTQLMGRIGHIKRAGRVRGRAQIGLRFDELRFLDGRTVPIHATLVWIDQRSSEKIGNDEGTIEGGAGKGRDIVAIGKTSAMGALIGVVAAGNTGAGVGALGGAVAGLGRVLLTRGEDAQIESRTRLRLRLTEDAKLR